MPDMDYEDLLEQAEIELASRSPKPDVAAAIEADLASEGIVLESATSREVFHVVNSEGWRVIKALLDSKVESMTDAAMDSEESGDKLTRLQCKAQAAREIRKWLLSEIDRVVRGEQ